MQKAVVRASKPAPPARHHPFVEAMIDPHATAVMRVPDGFKSGTTALKLVQEFTLSTNASGALFFGVGPGLARSLMSNTLTGTTTSATEGYTAHPDAASYYTGHTFARIVSYLVDITYIGAEQTSAGRLCCVNTVWDGNYTSTDINTMFDDATCVMPAQKGMSCIVRPYQEPRFEDCTGTSFGKAALQCMYFALAGGPASTVAIDVRITTFIEGVPQKTSLMRGMAAVEAYVPNAMAIAANIGTDSADTVENTVDAKRDRVSRARKMAGMAWRLLLAVGPSFGIPEVALEAAESLAAQLSSLRLGG